MIPINMADAAASIMAGDFGLIEDVRIGTLVISALKGFDGAFELNITERSIQAGFEMTLAARKLPPVFNLDIVLANPDFSVEAGITAALTGEFAGFSENWRDKKKELKRMQDDLEIVGFQSHEDIFEESYMVQRIAPYADVNENYDAYFANVTMKYVKTNKESWPVNSDLLDMAGEVAGGAM